MFAAWGLLVHRYRWPILVLAALSLLPSAWLATRAGRFDNNPLPRGTESRRALDLITLELPRRPASFGLILSSGSLAAGAPAFREAVERAIAPLRSDPRVVRLRTPWEGEIPAARSVSRDGRRVLVTVELRGGPGASVAVGAGESGEYADLRARVHSDALVVLPVGGLALDHDFTETARRAIGRAERVIWPVVPPLLVLVFGSVIAAVLPLGVGILGVAGGMAATLALSHVTPVSIYAVNVVSMIGFSVAVDYSLFVVSRFRDELGRHRPPEALARTLATAGRAVFFSGVTVAIGLLGMLVLDVPSLGSMGLAGTAVVTLAVLFALTFLPALLAILGPRVDALRLPFLRPEQSEWSRRAWGGLAAAVMAHPWRVLVPVALGLLLVGSPFLRLRVGASDATALPPTVESRRGEELLRREFAAGGATQVVVVLHHPDGRALGAERIGRAHAVSRWLAGLPGVSRVESLVDLDPRMTLEQYRQLAAAPPALLPPELRAARERTASDRLLVLVASSGLRAGSEAAQELVRTIRRAHPPVEGELLVTGQTALDLDTATALVRRVPLAVGVIMGATYVVLVLLLGSLLLPLKAVVMNLLSISASYGALVWIFQDGHLAAWLGFTPGPIETLTPILMFCVMFGLSMDYEVFLLSRVREEYERTGDNVQAVARSLEVSGRLITGAAAIMAVVFFAFGAADMVPIQAIGIGMGIAVVVDATIVRALLVPATMRLLGNWNWWAPGPLARLHRRVGLGEPD
ncbi:MAG: MMPL family transporter [Candidatus Rokubacteria bacterium]|nr:MMPL family transporter [Candidatus Rokubacteria bacterium]